MEQLVLLMQQVCRHAPSWYTSSNCIFVRATFLDIVSLLGMTLLAQTDATSILFAWEDLTAGVSIGPGHNIGPSDHQGDALLRTSLTRVFFIDRVILRDKVLGVMVSDDYQDIGDALMLLATEDPDTCLDALETLDTILSSSSSNDLTIPLSLVLAHIHRLVLSATDAEVTSKAQSVLASALTNPGLKHDFFLTVTQEKILATLEKLESQCLSAPPSNTQSALHLLGPFLDNAYATAHLSHRRQILAAIARYICLLRATITDTNPFDTRFAATQSLSSLSHIFTLSVTSQISAPLLLALIFILYDLLNDDDDEIRNLAARTTGTLLRAQGDSSVSNDTVPVLCTHRLGRFLCRRTATTETSTSSAFSQALQRECLRRLNPFADQGFDETFAELRREDTSLFATEKQNLYRDDVLDAVFFSRIFSHVVSSSSSQSSASTLQRLTKWVQDGLDVLNNTATVQDDGPLGWTSKDTVIALGTRVFVAAEVVLATRWAGGRGREEEVRRIVESLVCFSRIAEEKGVHGLWIERIKGICERHVLRSLGRVRESLVGVGVSAVV